jgi:hypothetical protein
MRGSLIFIEDDLYVGQPMVTRVLITPSNKGIGGSEPLPSPARSTPDSPPHGTPETPAVGETR